MLSQIKIIVISVLAVVAGMVLCEAARAQEQRTVRDIHANYKKVSDQAMRKETLLELSKAEPKTTDDMNELRAIFSKKDYDEHLFEAAIESLKKAKDPALDSVLIEILKDEKPFVDKATKKDFAGKSEGELTRRGTNIMFVIMKLGEMKSKKAVPILKEYLGSPNFQYQASEALAKIGDKSASEEMRERAYKGEEVNYGGLGLDEAIKVVQDLEDKNKKDQWPEIAKQLTTIRDPKAKPYLKKLFTHDVDYIRGQSAMAFSNLVTENDINDIMEMSKSADWFVRSRSIDAMKHLPGVTFDDVLIQMLMGDSADVIRNHAAKALGYKRIEKAVPYLEKALKDKSIRVREEAYIALYILTGQKYPYEGKSQRIEQKAEREKQTPSFW